MPPAVVIGPRSEPWKMTPAGLLTPQHRGVITKRFIRMDSTLTPEQRQKGADFYPIWHDDSSAMSHIMGGGSVTPTHAAAVLARLSPATGADPNRMMGFQFSHLFANGRMDRIDQAAQDMADNPLPMRTSKSGKKVIDTSHPDYDKIVSRREQIRQSVGISRGTPLANQSMINIAAAYHATQHSDPLSTLGKVKIGDFGRTIDNPDYGRAPIDTHIYDLGEGRTDIPYKAARNLTAVNKSGTNPHYEHRQAALESARQIAAPESRMGAFMGGLWFGMRDLKQSQNPGSASTEKAHQTMVNNFRNHPEAGMFDPVRLGRPSLQDF